METETRKLASVQRIAKISPHPNADMLELAEVLGWQVVVRKGEFSEGDFCVWFEIDSFLPREERYHFLAKNSYRKTEWGGEGYRLRTVRLRDQMSQGLALSFSFFSEIIHDPMSGQYYLSDNVWNTVDYEGCNLTDVLRIKKWDPPLPAQLRGKVKGYFPGFIQKTDQERFQNLKGTISQYHMDTEFEVTEKLDGSSMTVYVFGEKYGVCSRNLEIAEESEGNSFWEAAKKYNLIPAMQQVQKDLDFDFAIQGELIGPGIQKNPYKLTERAFMIYDAYDIALGRHFTPDERLTLLSRLIALGASIDQVPLITVTKISNIGIDKVLEYAEGESFLATGAEREGLVFKAMNVAEYKGKEHVFSFKVISNRFLLKEKE